MTTFYVYDHAGFFTHSTDRHTERSTETAPKNLTVTEVAGEMRSNWTGYEWQVVPYVHVPVPAASEKPWEWLIDIGPFFDRFGAAKMAVLTSQDAGVKAILQDVQVRKWLDLKRPDVAEALMYIQTQVPALTTALQTSILNTVVTAEENLALKKLYF